MKFGLNQYEKILFEEKLEMVAILNPEKVYLEMDHLTERIRAALWERNLKLTKERTLMLMLITILDAKRFPTAHTIDMYRKILKEEKHKIEKKVPPLNLPEQTGSDNKPGAGLFSCTVDWE